MPAISLNWNEDCKFDAETRSIPKHDMQRVGFFKLSSAEIIDLQHLSEFASGDVAQMRRFLVLFKEQSKIDFDNLLNSSSDDSWRDAAHSLKSGASAIGAWQLVQATDHAQNEEIKLTRACRQTHLDKLRGILREVHAFIENRLSEE